MRRYLYPLLLTGFLGAVGYILFFHKPDSIPRLQPRRGDLTLGGEWTNVQQAVEGLLAELRANPDNTKARLQLAQAYIQEGRVTGNHGYYDAAALDLLEEVLRLDPSNFEALCCQATVLLSQHHFTEALQVAHGAQRLNPHNSYIYGLLCDAYLELGNYAEAVRMADKMVSVRPDLRSYARVSYLREIHGDMPGAIEAMKLAVSAGYPGLEQTAWTQIQLGRLYEISGDLSDATALYERALAERPRYPFALAGLGRVAAAQKRYREAINYLTAARRAQPDFTFAEELSDVYRQVGQADSARRCAEDVVKSLAGVSGGDEDNPGHGHYADRELAYAYLKVGKPAKALEHALIEYERRPDNIDVQEVTAWAYYHNGQYGKAQQLIRRALRTNSQSPALRCRAGLIAVKAGDRTGGLALLRQALERNPYLEPALAGPARRYLKGAPQVAVAR